MARSVAAARAARAAWSWIGAAVLLGAAAGCQSGGGGGAIGLGFTRWSPGSAVRVWAVPEEEVVFPDAQPVLESELFSSREGLVRLAGAVNEVVAFQLVIEGAAGERVDGVTVGPLVRENQRIGPEQVRLYRQQRIEVSEYSSWFYRLTPWLRAVRAYPDVLVPLSAPRGALPIALRAGEVEAVWVDVRIPPGTQAGGYEGSIEVRPQRGGDLRLKVRLEVWPFALPGTRHMPMLATLDTGRQLSQHMEVQGRAYVPGRLTLEDPSYPDAVAILDAAMRLLHEHRCGPILRDVQPVRRFGNGGQLEVGFSDYDRLVAGVLDGALFADRQAIEAWPMPIDARNPSPDAYGGWGSPGYERMVTEYLRACAKHFSDQGWLDRGLVWLPTVEGLSRAERYRRAATVGDWVRRADGRLRMLSELPPYSLAPYGLRDDGYVDLSAVADVWAVRADEADGRVLAELAGAGGTVWLSPAEPPYSGSLSVEAPAADARSVPWQAWRCGASAVLLGEADGWPGGAEPRAEGSAACLIWPGKAYGLESPVPSVRLKRLRRGAQDVEYLWLLGRNRRPGLAGLIAGDLFPFGGTSSYGEHLLDGRPNGWVADASAWGLARRLMAAELAEVINQADPTALPDEAERLDRFARLIEWGRLTGAVRQVQLAIEGARIVPRPAGTTGGYEIELAIEVFNATRAPLHGRIELAEAPAEWSWLAAPDVIEGLAPGRGTRRYGRVRADRLMPNVEGVVPVAVDLLPPGAEPVRAEGRLAVLAAAELVRPIVVDGRLDEWPLGDGNVAGDWILVGARDVPKVGRASPDRPSQPTSAFVARDAEAMYIAFRCQDDRLAERRIARDNYVHYDGLWPTGDDQVEVLLDPSGRAADPGELLHIVVKSNGAVLSERGVPCLSAVSDHQPWPAGVQAAVAESPAGDAWLIELRIPLAALGERAEVCGINFGRYVPRLGEYSSWSGARRQLYSPTVMGNLQLGR